MAVTDITPIVLAVNEASDDEADADATSIATGADGFAVAADDIGRGRNVLLKFVETGTDTATVTIDAGEKPPAMHAPLGDVEVELAASDVKYIAVELARVLQEDGTITGTVSGNSADAVAMSVYVLPIGI